MSKATTVLLAGIIITFLNFPAYAENSATKALSNVQLQDNLIKKNEVLTLEQCLNIALNNNPNISLAKNTTKVYQSKIGEAKSNYLPQLSMSTGYSRDNNPTNTSFDPTNNQYSANITLNQMIYDFGKTSSKTRIQKLNLSSSKSDVDDASAQIAYNVKQAYYTALLAKINKDIYTQSIKQYEQHLNQAKAFFEVGTKSKIDVTTAEVNLSNAKLNYITANDAYKTAIAILNNAMGLTNAPSYDVADTVTFKRPQTLKNKDIKVNYKSDSKPTNISIKVLKSTVEKHNIIENLSFQKFNVTFEEAIKKAFDNRPDLKSSITKESAANESINLAKKDYYPSVSGFANYGFGGQKFPIDSGWSFGGNVNIPVFNGLLTKNQVNEAKANLDVAKSSTDILRQNIYLQVQQAFINLTEAEKRIPVAELTVKQSKENYELANGRYSVGVGSAVELQDAETSYNNAQLSYVRAFYDYNTAHAALERAMGVTQ